MTGKDPTASDVQQLKDRLEVAIDKISKLESGNEKRENIKTACEVAAAISALILPVVIAGVGFFIQQTLDSTKTRTDVVQKFVMDVSRGETDSEASIIVIAQLVNNQEAMRLAQLFPSEGSYSGLAKLAANQTSVSPPNFPEAIKIATAAYAVARKLPTPSNTYSGVAAFDVGRIYEQQKNIAKARAYYEQAARFLKAPDVSEEIKARKIQIIDEFMRKHL